MDYIRLVDINQSTVEETWPLLLTAVEQASFIAIDLVSCHSIIFDISMYI